MGNTSAQSHDTFWLTADFHAFHLKIIKRHPHAQSPQPAKLCLRVRNLISSVSVLGAGAPGNG